MDRFPVRSQLTVEELCRDFNNRRLGLIKALTTDADMLYLLCDPREGSLCLYGTRDRSWYVTHQDATAPPTIPEPAIGINFIRDYMPRKRWISIVARASDTWLLSVTFYLGALYGFTRRNREELFHMINTFPTLNEIVQEQVRDLKERALNRSDKTTSLTENEPMGLDMLMEMDEIVRVIGEEMPIPKDDKVGAKLGQVIPIQTDENVGAKGEEMPVQTYENVGA